ncbi:MAG: M4 family metallopeptidase [Actinomycetota bacterium]
MRRALTILGVLTLLTTLLVTAPVAAQNQSRRGPRVVPSEDSGAPAFVSRLTEPALRGKPVDLALSHLSSNPSLYEIDAPAAELEAIAVERDEDRSTVRFQQLYRGVEVFGAHYLVHFEEEGVARSVSSVNGSYFTELETSVEARISEDTAQRLAVARLRGVSVERVDNHGLVVLPEGDGVTAYHFTLWGSGHKGPVRQQVFISAQSGVPVLSYNDLQGADPVPGTGDTVHGETVDLSIFQDATEYKMRGFLDPNPEPPPPTPLPDVVIRTYDADRRDGLTFQPSGKSLISSPDPHFDGPSTNRGAVDAHWGTERVFEFYKALGRNSIDNEGMAIVSVVDATEAGRPMYNAFWDGEKMVYGNPERNSRTREVHPFSADLDIVAHELTHGVIEHSADFVYLGQSGAMNEAYADYFGNAVDVTVSGTPMDDPEAGYIAEDLCRVPNPENWECPLRDLNETKTGDPTEPRGVEDYGFYLVDFDNGGVHLNSTIFSGALWDIRERLDPEVADELLYTALTQYGTPLDDFVDGRLAIDEAAAEMELTNGQLAVIDEAFDSRGIEQDWDDSPGTSDAENLIPDAAPLGFFVATPQVSGTRYVFANHNDKETIFEKPQDIVVGNVPGSRWTINKNLGDRVVFEELPDIGGEQVVWARGNDVGGGRLGFDVVNKKIGGGMRTIASTSDFEWFPSIDGNLVAWERLGNQTDVWARRIGKLPRRITNSRGAHELYPQVSGRKIAFWDDRADRIGIKDFKTGARTVIKHSSLDAFLGPPAINDTHVFWFQDANNDGTGAIMRAKHNGKRKKALVKESSEFAPFFGGFTLEPPRISANNNFLVYTDEFGFSDPDEQVGRDVWHIPVTGGDPRLVTCNRGDQAYASIGSGQRAVWLDGSLGRTDLMTRSEPSTCP